MKKLLPFLALALFATLVTAVAIDMEIVIGNSSASVPPTVRISVSEGPSAKSFDEALWTALGNLASIEAQLPQHLEIMEVEIRPANYITQPLRMTFSREDFSLLMAGLMSPAQFMRESVVFDM